MTTSSGSRRISTSAPRSSRSSNPSRPPGPEAATPRPRSDAETLRPRTDATAPPSGTLILGIDPGSRATGYGLLRLDGSRLHYERSGVIAPRSSLSFSDKLLAIYEGLMQVLDDARPHEVAVETAFVRKSAHSALQIGHVRGVVLLAARQRGAEVHEYTAPEVKLAVVRQGAAAKHQVGFMVRRLLPAVGPLREDEADALAVALCHAHRATTRMLAARTESRSAPARPASGGAGGSTLAARVAAMRRRTA